ncbi:MAG: hypothetical protein GX331_02460 [Firmicutes bacterium]|nr:hypothetical protein [Bacillota bacterium]
MRKRTDLIIIMSLLVLLIAGLLSPSVWAETNSERVVVLDFLTLDENGNYIDTLALKHTDLVNLSRIMSQGIAARLVQYGEFDVLDSISLRDEINSLGFTYETSAYERAQVLLESNLADQVITGSITLLQNTAVLGVQRFQMIDGQPTLAGSAMGTTARVSDAPSLVDTLVSSLFPADVQVIERSIEQVFVVPSQIRMNLGGSKQITVYALDSMGRPVTNPEFLYFSSDESKVEVNEHGVVRGLQPGTSTITVRAISRTARSGSPATMSVTVVPPVLGVRVGTLVTNRAGIEGRPIRLGVRLTPTVDQRGTQQKTVTPTQTAPDVTNPLSLVSSFFSSLLTNGLITIDLDFDPTKELLVAFSGVQRSASGYIGTGVGYLSPLDDLSAEKGFVFRFTLGSQYRPSDRFTLPIEAVMDAIFPTSSAFKPTFRIGINVGFDLFP